MRSDLKRSRTGCETCRKHRFKCDERRPTCFKCEERGVPCAGYALRLRWMGVSSKQGSTKPGPAPRPPQSGIDEPASQSRNKEATALSLFSAPASGSQRAQDIVQQLPRSLNLYEHCFRHPQDRDLFEHYQQTFLQAVYMSRVQSTRIQTMYTSAIMEPRSATLPVVLATAAAHLSAHSISLMSSVQLYTRKQRALEALRGSLSIMQQQVLPQTSPDAFYGDLLTASVGLAGIEVTLGADYDLFIAIVMGSTSLVKQYRKHSTGRTAPPLFQLSQKMLAYLDVMSAVPCPRLPILDREYWFTDADAGIDGSEVDPTFGCFATVLALTSDSSALVYRWFTGTMGKDDFHISRRMLRHSLRSWTPPIRKPDSQTTQDDYIAGVAAGRAHSIASQIFLQRSTDPSETLTNISRDVQDLRQAILQVAIESPSITTMLWPLFVLGCESWNNDAGREEVVARIQSMLDRQKFMNINTCLQTLQTRMWTLKVEEQRDWVRYCWDNNIRLILA